MVQKPNTLKKKTSRKSKADKAAEKPISLAPLSFEDALKGLVKVRPVKKSRA